MTEEKVKLVIGFITYSVSAKKYLPEFLKSIKNQTFENYKIIAVDNNEKEENENKNYISDNYPDISLFWMGTNLGFSGANNKIIEMAQNFNSEYIMFLNPDTVLEKSAIEKMIEELDGDEKLGSASAKIKVWDFDNNKKTEMIDSCGVVMRPGLRFVDLGQGQKDCGQYDNSEILGPSGTAPIYRMSALNKVKEDSGYFDERMFMYKEDCDLAYRLFLAGFKSRLVSKAILHHHRTAKGEGESIFDIINARKGKSRQIKTWSFKNQFLIFRKHWRKQNIKNKFAVIVNAIKMLVFALFFERYLLK